MNVLHVYRTYFPDTQGGLEEVIRQIALNTKQLGTNSRIFTLSNSPSDEPLERDEGQVFQVPLHLELSSCGISLTAQKEFNEMVEWADIVNYHFPWPFADILHLRSKCQKPTVLTYHSDIVRQRVLSILYQPLMRRFLAQMHKIVCTSPNYFATSNVLTKFQDKVEVIPIGLDTEQYMRTDEHVADRAVDIGGTYFFFIGVLRYYKGLHILLEAMQDAPYRVVIAGSGPTENSLKQQSERLGLKNVIFAGRVSDAVKVQLLLNARGIVFPSYLRAEAFGVTLLEGAMFEKPLISTEVGSGTSHVNIHNKTGIVVAPGSAKSLRRAMDKLATNEALAIRMGKAARERFDSLFSGRLMGERYYKLYLEMLGITTSEPSVQLKTSSADRC